MDRGQKQDEEEVVGLVTGAAHMTEEPLPGAGTIQSV